MDKTHLGHTSSIGVYRKYEMDMAKHQSDSSMCDDIYNNMRVLAVFHPFSDGLKENFEVGMFLKSNTKAFPHVMKYLFTILDPNEFKKKFCWPLYNKAAEATFRNSSLEFLIKLNAKHKLNFGELKNKIVVFPGGTDFMHIVVELTKLAMRFTLKRNGVETPHVNQMSLCNAMANRKLQETQMLYNNVMVYTEQLHIQASELKERTLRIRKLIENLTESTNISMTDIINHGFCVNWQETQNQIVENGVQPHMQRLKVFRTNCERLEIKINELIKKQTAKYDAETFSGFIDGMRTLYPIHFHQLSNCANQHYINMNNLLLAFRLALPLISKDAQTHTPRSLDVINYEAKGVEKLAVQVNNILHRAAMRESQTNQIIGNTNVPVKGKTISMKNTNAMKSTIFGTPPIPMNVIKRREKATKRISLVNENFPISTHNATRSMPIDDVLKTDGQIFISPIRSTTTSKSNPRQMLSTIEKNGRFCRPSNRQMRFESSKYSVNNAKESYNLPRCTSIDSKDPDNINQSLVFISSPTHHHSNVDTPKDLPSFQSVLRKRPPIDEEQLRKHNDVNRSPSGRLEIFLLAEQNANEQNISINICKEIAIKKVNSSPMNLVKTTQISLGKSLGVPTAATVNHSNIENNLNASNTNKFSLFHLIDENDESLLNISDSVLASINVCNRVE